MIYLLKFIGCSGLLLLFYYGVLQNERLFRFNRFFLLAIVVIALIVPLTVVKTKIIEAPAVQEVHNYAKSVTTDELNYALPLSQATQQPEATFNIPWPSVLWSTYALITAVLLIRFFRNLNAIVRLKDRAHVISDKGIKIVLREDIRASFSFLNLMYTNKTRFEQGNLPEEIIEHERHHITQRHSYDIIYIEFVQCLLWFNPFIYFIKKAIKLNHEFLADQHVLKSQSSAYEYQKILLNITRKQQVLTPVLASNLNYGFTKKRLNMMTKNTNRFKSMIKQIAAAGIIACTFWFGGATRLIAQEVDLSPNKDLSVEIDLDRNLTTDVSMDLNPNIELDIQDTLKKKKKPTQELLPPPPIKLDKVRFKDSNGRTIEKRYSELSQSEKERFRDSTSDPEFYMPPPPPSYIDEEMLEDFQNTKKYGVWLNNKRVDNEAIKSLKVMDIHHYFKSRLYKNAANYGKHEYQLNIVTREYYKTRPEANGTWLEYIYPTRIKKKVQEQFQEKNEALEEVAEVEEIPQMSESEEVVEVPEVANIPIVFKVKAKPEKVKPAKEKKETPKVKEIKAKDQKKGESQDLQLKKGQFNPQLHSPGIDLEKVEYFLAPTSSAHLKYISKSGESVIKTYGDMNDSEYSMWVNPKNNGQVFNPPQSLTKITLSQLLELKNKKELKFWIDGELASPTALADLDYFEVYDWKLNENMISITSHYTFLNDESAWISRIRFKKAEE
ncbi:M56 family metallopeptidase [Roseivirga sp. E12]|uniref:M56 family metallopeptidase n=1 Tax=Roseivirga sp. E12 TaxID=2819237 RepID=UPI001ABCC2E5|nr:M56 family metallopeptidase [Roseivirga sp. E12]MBO3700631.1 M56 family metallopeptidase [Roseivirga sp. E12]